MIAITEQQLDTLQCLVEVLGFIERLNLNIVGKQHIDVAIHQLEKTFSVPIHAEAIREGQGELATRFTAGFSGGDEGPLAAGLSQR